MKNLLTTLFLFLALFIAIFMGNDASASANLFGKSEERNSDIDEFPKWIKVLDKKTEELETFSHKCTSESKAFYCNIKDWRNFVDTLKGKTKPEQINAVNSYVNAHKYILDINNWGVTDYWESPGEFLFRNGDCEDFAIIKYLSLKQLGFDVNDLRVVVLMDNNLGVYHSVLATYIGDDIYILDNQLFNVTRSTNILHYNPVYSINEKSWWRYF